jgi:uncharacterized protein
MDDLERTVEQIRAVLADEPVRFSYVFGSLTRGTATATSDVDVALSFEQSSSPQQRHTLALHLGAALELALARPVDVVDLAEAPLRLAGRILTERVVVTGLDSPERVVYETDLFPRYLDFEYHARRLDAALLAATASGDR